MNESSPNRARIARSRPGKGRAAGIGLGLLALAGAGFAGWTLYSVTRSPAPVATPDAPETGMADMSTIEAVLASVQELVKDENFAAAEKVLSESVRKFPTDQDLRLAFGDFLMGRQRWQEAYDQYGAAIQAGPVPARVQFAAGTLANMAQRPELAAEHYRKAMETDAGVVEYPMYLAAVQMKMNRLNEAKASLALAARIDESRADIWGMFAQVALNENKPVIAEQQIAKARALEPDEPAWVLMDARIRKRDARPQEALDLISALPQTVIDEPETLELLSECYGMLGRPAEAASRYMDASERNPRDAELAFQAALWLDRSGERGEAIDWAKRAAMLGSEAARTWLDANPDTGERP